MKKNALLCLLAFASILLAACRAYEPPEPVYLKIAGSTSMRPLLEDLAEAYSRRHRHVTIEVVGGDSRLGMELARKRQVDLGACSRQLEGEKLWSTPIALDGIAIIVHPSNRVESLTLLQLGDIFFGRVLDWKDVGGRGGEIRVISREEGSGTRAAFEEMVMGGKRVTPAAVVVPGSRAVVEYVAEHPGAIGYVSMGCISSQVKVLRIEGLQPTPESVGKGYHLVRPFLLLAAEEPTGEVKAFVDFILGPRGQAIVGEKYERVR